MKEVARISLVIPSSGRRVVVPMKSQLRIGRADARRDMQPEIDLSEDGAAGAGVSRLHAVVVQTDQGVAITDLDSANGTRLNDRRLPPNLPYALESGDEIKLGELLIHVFLEG
jgi:pSer/pThr/pTyr-binding forkhead associated (FHA) protein